jgi:outer membrane protein OmpA-like peptidoglycan-associated protein
MSVNLLSLAQQAMGNDFGKMAAQFLGESPETTQSAMGALLPTVLGSIASKGATPDGAASLLSLINGAKLDTNALGNLAGMFGDGGSAMNSLLKLGSSSLVPSLFGDKAGALVSALSSGSGMKTSSSTNLLAMLVPLVLMVLKKLIGERGLNPSSLASLLGGQGESLKTSLDPRLTGALGFSSPAAFLSGLGGQAADAAKRAGAAVASGAGAAAATAGAAAAATKSGLMRWLPWIIAAAVLLLLWNMFSGRKAPEPAPMPKPAASAPAAAPAAPAPAMAAFPAKVYFDVGSAVVGADGAKAIAAAADAAKKDGLKVAITGYTDKTGDTAKNEELAKARAKAVRDALVAAGVAEAGIEMRAPLFVEVGAGGSDAEARRVEISKL